MLKGPNRLATAASLKCKTVKQTDYICTTLLKCVCHNWRKHATARAHTGTKHNGSALAVHVVVLISAEAAIMV